MEVLHSRGVFSPWKERPMPDRRLAGFRRHKDEFFAGHDESPLTPEQRERFTGLAYFPENPDLALALNLDTSGEHVGERIMLGTSDGSAKPFLRAGRVHFAVNGTPVTLTLFKDAERGRFFLPFRDATAGTETYPVGRYLDPQVRPDDRLVVDFNYAYNPYCAYGDDWSCPIPPQENVVSVRIEAGEKAFPLRPHEEA
jgi:uncharacterized protein (DUF1684 family)